MTATKKLFIAAILLTTGFGVARLMGRPDAPWLASQAAKAPLASRDVVARPIVAGMPAAPIENGSRLVPDSRASDPYRPRTDADAVNSAPTLQVTTTANGSSVAPPPFVSIDGNLPAHRAREPIAKLRDEAPRPLIVDSRGPSPAYALSAVTVPVVNVDRTDNTRAASADYPASGLAQTGFAPQSNSVATINTAYSQPVGSSENLLQISPPPWPERDEAIESRSHVVVDGDSLERLAGRYLDDSSRGHEIYEANRDLLASPDLLPIGAELVIPKRQGRALLDATSPQSSAAANPSLRAAAYRDSPRPIPFSHDVAPRAQLLPPTPVD